ncbi:MAG: anthranilate phosphoribosyltransferase [Deltaproteobacteria bacterium]|nr:anthranilate phosphoribosyltransferase [Deltaproteobacteria bacterium]
MFTETLQKIVAGYDLYEEEATRLMDLLMAGDLTDAQIGAFMAALAAKGESFEELAGAARAMRRKAVRVQTPGGVVVDTCGTGGDGKNTFNISTTSAFVVAGAGVTVAKHGNRAASSKSGSADVLEALGVNVMAPPEKVEEAIAAVGIGFLFAPLYHGAMKHAARARKEVGIRSIFNMLGPLTNPAGAGYQVLGVYDPKLTEMFASALNLLKAKRAFVVHGHEGLDEISVCEKTRISELRDGHVRTYDISPEQIIGRRWLIEDLRGGTPARNAEITRMVLSGEPGACADVVVANAAAALIVTGLARDFSDAVPLARKSIESGAALKKLDDLVAFMKS